MVCAQWISIIPVRKLDIDVLTLLCGNWTRIGMVLIRWSICSNLSVDSRDMLHNIEYKTLRLPCLWSYDLVEEFMHKL